MHDHCATSPSLSGQNITAEGPYEIPTFGTSVSGCQVEFVPSKNEYQSSWLFSDPSWKTEILRPSGSITAPRGEVDKPTFGTYVSGCQLVPSKNEYQSVPGTSSPRWKTDIPPPGNTIAEGSSEIPTFGTSVSGAQFVPSKNEYQSCPLDLPRFRGEMRAWDQAL